MSLSSSGYSATPLATKLGMKEGTRFMPVNAPPGYLGWLGELPKGVTSTTRVSAAVDIVHVFSKARADLKLYNYRLAECRLR